MYISKVDDISVFVYNEPELLPTGREAIDRVTMILHRETQTTHELGQSSKSVLSTQICLVILIGVV